MSTNQRDIADQRRVALLETGKVSKTSDTGSVVLPVGNTTQRDPSPLAGYVRWNTQTGAIEVYNGTQWKVVTGTPRVSTATSSATPTINTNNVDIFGLTAQAVNITSFSTNLSGTPVNGQRLWIYIIGTAARTIAWGASFEASTVPLPTTTVSTNRLDVGFVWNATTSKWRCVATA